MRCAVELEPHVIKTAELYAPGRKGSDAVSWILDDYPRLVAEIRDLRRRVAQIDSEAHALDVRLEALQIACRAILEL